MCDYDASTTLPSANLRPMTTGAWKIQLIDEELHVVAGAYETLVKNGGTSLPTAGGFMTGDVPGRTVRLMAQTTYGSLPTSINRTVGNMTVTRFNGASYLSLANDPGLSMNGGHGLYPSGWISLLGDPMEYR